MSLPVIFSASVTLPTITQGGNFSVPLDSRRLVNTYHLPVEIHELRFSVRRDDVLSGILGNLFHPGVLVAVRLAAGADRITGDDPVPLYGIGSQLSPVFFEDSDATNGELDISLLAPPDTVSSTWHTRWVFPRPLIVPPGQAILGTVSQTDFGPGFILPSPVPGMVFSMAAVGRYLPGTLPRLRSVPYISAYQFRLLEGGVVTERRHPERVFQNPFPVPLHVQRFVGRVALVNDSSFSGFPVESLGFDYSAATPNGSPMIVAEAPFGYIGTRDPTPIDRVFDHQRRVWDCPHGLAPRDHWKFTVHAEADDAGRPADATMLPMISMIGHREEAL